MQIKVACWNYWCTILTALLAVGALEVGARDMVGNTHAASGQHHGHEYTVAAAVANGQAPQPSYARTLGTYIPPKVRLTSSEGSDVVLSELLAEDSPVLLQFIFTSCATICPLLSATFARGQDPLTSTHEGYRMLSISIDPEYDTPKRLADYAKRNNAGDNWTFLTGSRGDIGKVMRAFDVLYQGDNKMYHQPYTFLRARADAPWVRIDGILTVGELVKEYRASFQLADAGFN
jgi:cytochrome oxidase Cu insertion factor (SCO1/SenC/PrrC family)